MNRDAGYVRVAMNVPTLNENENFRKVRSIERKVAT